MEWLKKLLKSKGVADEVIQTVVAAAEEKFKNFIPKHRFSIFNPASSPKKRSSVVPRFLLSHT
ncbi:hypothetical protein [Carboxydothermus hydrogenoformans]|uniref:Uncharacterized protein n=1 Tax=Carboxydothermus hydrogenoformans (strain ATCC BAA-161 / DSM 6008 / Z-2901) TaxID=246194 RepID=Q3AA43_CARHZ|nr:hypothetical protein [Carboxydothermus hydrogenoformans]ABB14745.1 hypothetical protein CHY_2177 [Carboxydothermus hydrogenoformans Z-2901]